MRDHEAPTALERTTGLHPQSAWASFGKPCRSTMQGLPARSKPASRTCRIASLLVLTWRERTPIPSSINRASGFGSDSDRRALQQRIRSATTVSCSNICSASCRCSVSSGESGHATSSAVSGADSAARSNIRQAQREHSPRLKPRHIRPWTPIRRGRHKPPGRGYKGRTPGSVQASAIGSVCASGYGVSQPPPKAAPRRSGNDGIGSNPGSEIDVCGTSAHSVVGIVLIRHGLPRDKARFFHISAI
jgi:hypothetical protein